MPKMKTKISDKISVWLMTALGFNPLRIGLLESVLRELSFFSSRGGGGGVVETG